MADNPKQSATKPAASNEAPDNEVPRHKRRRRKTEVAQLNMTSMIDVVFQLLIYFIVTVNFVIDEGVLITNLPEVGNPPVPPPPPPIKVRLEANYGDDVATLSLQNEIITSYTELQAKLRALQLEHGGFFPKTHAVNIEPSVYVRWQYVLNAFNAALQAEYENVSFPATNQSGG